jgi:hypothetical protein
MLAQFTMSKAIQLTIRQPIEVMNEVVKFFSGRGTLTLEGDLSAVDWSGVPEATVSGHGSLVTIPLNSNSLPTIIASVLPRVGLKTRVLHVIVRQGQQLLFAAYDQFAERMVVVEAEDAHRLRGILADKDLIMGANEVDMDGPSRVPGTG